MMRARNKSAQAIAVALILAGTIWLAWDRLAPVLATSDAYSFYHRIHAFDDAGFPHARFAIQCLPGLNERPGSLSWWIDQPALIGLPGLTSVPFAPVILTIDSDDPIRVRGFVSESSESLYKIIYTDGDGLAEKLDQAMWRVHTLAIAKGDRLAVRFVGYHGRSVDLSFDTTELRALIPQMKSACKL